MISYTIRNNTSKERKDFYGAYNNQGTHTTTADCIYWTKIRTASTGQCLHPSCRSRFCRCRRSPVTGKSLCHLMAFFILLYCVYPRYVFTLQCKHAVSHLWKNNAQLPLPEKSGSFDDLCFNCRNLYTGLPACTKRNYGAFPVCTGLGNRLYRNFPVSLLYPLPEVGIRSHLHRHGLVLSACLSAAFGKCFANGVCTASWRRRFLYRRRSNLCTKASDF